MPWKWMAERWWPDLYPGATLFTNHMQIRRHLWWDVYAQLDYPERLEMWANEEEICDVKDTLMMSLTKLIGINEELELVNGWCSQFQPGRPSNSNSWCYSFVNGYCASKACLSFSFEGYYFWESVVNAATLGGDLIEGLCSTLCSAYTVGILTFC